MDTRGRLVYCIGTLFPQECAQTHNFISVVQNGSAVVPWHYRAREGDDFWRVLRMRPSQTYDKASKDFEYLPNSVYPYTRVKQTLWQTAQINIKPSRYWNELLLKDVPEDILYSLSDYCPGIP